MDTIYDIVLILHIVSWAFIIGAWLTHLRPPVIAKGVWHAAATAVLTGVAMVGIASASDAVDDPNNTKIAVKLVVALVVVTLAFLGQRSADKVQPGVVHAVGGLAVVNVAIAVLWT